MKPKLICLLIILIVGSLVASPNNYCGDVRCPGKLAKQVTVTTAKKVVLMIDDMELLPSHHFLNNF